MLELSSVRLSSVLLPELDGASPFSGLVVSVAGSLEELVPLDSPLLDEVFLSEVFAEAFWSAVLVGSDVSGFTALSVLPFRADVIVFHE